MPGAVSSCDEVSCVAMFVARCSGAKCELCVFPMTSLDVTVLRVLVFFCNRRLWSLMDRD